MRREADPISRIFLALAGGAAHGAEIRRRVEDDSRGEVTLYPAMLYGTLDELTREGWISEVHPGDVDRDGAGASTRWSPRDVVRSKPRRSALKKWWAGQEVPGDRGRDMTDVQDVRVLRCAPAAVAAAARGTPTRWSASSRRCGVSAAASPPVPNLGGGAAGRGRARRGGGLSAPAPGDGNEIWGGDHMDEVMQDLRYALRQLARRPGLRCRAGAHAGAGDRREHRGVQRRGRRAAASPSVSRARPAHRGLDAIPHAAPDGKFPASWPSTRTTAPSPAPFRAPAWVPSSDRDR